MNTEACYLLSYVDKMSLTSIPETRNPKSPKPNFKPGCRPSDALWSSGPSWPEPKKKRRFCFGFRVWGSGLRRLAEGFGSNLPRLPKKDLESGFPPWRRSLGLLVSRGARVWVRGSLLLSMPMREIIENRSFRSSIGLVYIEPTGEYSDAREPRLLQRTLQLRF